MKLIIEVDAENVEVALNEIRHIFKNSVSDCGVGFCTKGDKDVPYRYCQVDDSHPIRRDISEVISALFDEGIRKMNEQYTEMKKKGS